jgi:diguanylate cyclase (GGDEF)-like protein
MRGDQLSPDVESGRPDTRSATGSRIARSRKPGIPQEWLRVVQDVAGVGVWDWRIESPAANCTPSNTALYGLPPGTVMPPYQDWLGLIHCEDRARVVHDIERALTGCADYETEFRVVWPDGSVRWLAGKGRAFRSNGDNPVRLIGVNYDITRLKELEIESRRSADRLAYEATHDMLTGLPNRRFFEQALMRAIAEARAASGMVALLHIDLDGFKFINDSWGHHFGDELLRQTAARLTRVVETPGDIPARIGGDEFNVILTGTIDPAGAEEISVRLLNVMQEAFFIEGQELYVTASIGFALHPLDGDDAGELQQRADLALYSAKARGKNGVRRFSTEMMEPVRQRLGLDSQLRHAVNREELHLHYQPVLAIDKTTASAIVVAFEALLRWRHPGLGDVPPSRFIPVAEETGLILRIGSWVLDEACRRIEDWLGRGYRDFRINVNICGLQFARPDFVATVEDALRRHDVPPEFLCLELTESILMVDLECGARKIAALRDRGITTQIDDFGTGYSSLAYLQSLPLSALKIDGSFIRDIGARPNSEKLLRGIVSLAHGLNLRVVVECVETAEQLRIVSLAGCDEVQGYLFGKAMPPAAALDWWNAVRTGAWCGGLSAGGESTDIASDLAALSSA